MPHAGPLTQRLEFEKVDCLSVAGTRCTGLDSDVFQFRKIRGASSYACTRRGLCTASPLNRNKNQFSLEAPDAYPILSSSAVRHHIDFFG